MGRLKRKLEAGTILETIVATIVILCVFVLSSLILNNTFKSLVKNDTYAVENRIQELLYFQSHGQILLPYQETFEGFDIDIRKEKEENIHYLIVETTSSKFSKKTTIYYVKI